MSIVFQLNCYYTTRLCIAHATTFNTNQPIALEHTASALFYQHEDIKEIWGHTLHTVQSTSGAATRMQILIIPGISQQLMKLPKR